MRDLLRMPATGVWALLVVLAGVSWTLGTAHGISAGVVAVCLIAVAVFKVRCVGLYFMELRDAPLALRAVFEGYVAVMGTALVVIYLLT